MYFASITIHLYSITLPGEALPKPTTVNKDFQSSSDSSISDSLASTSNFDVSSSDAELPIPDSTDKTSSTVPYFDSDNTSGTSSSNTFTHMDMSRSSQTEEIPTNNGSSTAIPPETELGWYIYITALQNVHKAYSKAYSDLNIECVSKKGNPYSKVHCSKVN